MKYSALIGSPTEHSVSHIMYSELAKAANLDFFYEHIRIDIDQHRLGPALEAFNELNFIGLNVTLPYKLDIIDHIDELDPVIEELGAVNTIKLGKTTIGYNTDWIGIAESVKRFGGSRQYETAAIFGTGGAARAAIYACKQLGIKSINVFYRVEASEGTHKLEQQSDQLGIVLHEYTEVANVITDSQLIINATSAGMVGKELLPFNLELIKDIPLKDKVFLDAVFNPLQTSLLTHFGTEGAVVIDGLWMMMYQGIAALSIWLDHEIKVPVNDLTGIHNLLAKELKNV
jgi:shikimate dehydrogenase